MLKNAITKYFFLAVFLVFYFLVRIPFFYMGWDGSDANGLDVDMFLNHPKNPDYLLIARIDGVDQYVPAMGHPAPMYEMFSQLGYFFQSFENYSTLTDAQIIFRAKALSAIVQALVFVSLLWIVLGQKMIDLRKKGIWYLGIVTVSVTPIALSNSNEFQIDSFFGLLMVGLYGLVLTARLWGSIPESFFYGLLFLTSAFIGLGKNEWSLLLGLALVISVTCIFFSKYVLKKKFLGDSFWIVGISVMGCLLGNLLSYLFEPMLYVSGWNLLFSMTGQSSILSVDGFQRFWGVTKERMLFVAPILVMLVYLGFLLVKNRKKIEFVEVLGYLFASALFFSFFFSTWGSYPRYFAPAFILTIIVCSWVFIKYQEVIKQKTAWIFLGVFAVSAYFSIGYLSDDTVKSRHTYGVRSFQLDKSCVALVPVEDVYRKKNINFVHTGMGMEAAQKIAEEHGKTICKTK